MFRTPLKFSPGLIWALTIGFATNDELYVSAGPDIVHEANTVYFDV